MYLFVQAVLLMSMWTSHMHAEMLRARAAQHACVTACAGQTGDDAFRCVDRCFR